MKELAKNYPQYGFEKHAGYPTKAHIEVIKQYGPTKFHRQAFRGVKEFTESNSFFENYKENVVLYQKENKNSHDFGIYWEMGGKRSL